MEIFGKVVKINEKDNVAVALHDINTGEQIDTGNGIITAREPVPSGHKIAWKDISSGENVIKYGYPIGHATRTILQGEWIHTHNVKTNLEGLEEYVYSPADIPKPVVESSESVTFQGYVHENGQVGIRNEIWIIPTVGCINKTAERLAQMADKAFSDRNIDGVYSFGHPYGCSELGDDLRYTQKILRGLIRHPNAGGVLVLGLGCENNNIPEMLKILGDDIQSSSFPNVEFLNMQSVQDELDEGMAKLEELVQKAEKAQREPVPVSKLVIGLKCGGSDGFSGITANPLIGMISDRLVAMGGTTILTEVPEMFGAETILMDRSINKEVFEKTVRLINDFKSYFIRYGQPVYENPSPGNKEGGITTLEDKSLGCTQKGGTSSVVDVLDYGEQVVKNGLNLLNGPGNDLVSSTVMAAAGAHMVLFSTGRGTPYGCAVPTVKISTNSTLAKKKTNWIDFNAGVLLEGQSAQKTADELFDLICQVASGKKTRNEINGFREIAIFKDGVTL
ncbi:MAG: UxaA family hydrolase [Caldicoprobacterales bacterium]|jgi:altronate hydrolase|nr:altronate dehydratase [Clostridiales bacterium]